MGQTPGSRQSCRTRADTGHGARFRHPGSGEFVTDLTFGVSIEQVMPLIQSSAKTVSTYFSPPSQRHSRRSATVGVSSAPAIR
ncbi:MAG: hypothetical protein AB1925_09845 [Actinomycetota bacterium]